jgi:LacI family transcriptional regulator
LRACGFERFAFLGVSGTLWSGKREEGFRRGITSIRGTPAETGAEKVLPSFERSLSWWEGAPERGDRPEAGALESFLGSLAPPTGLFACNDTTGLRATELARELGIAVPESLAVLGVDDEDIVCELASPSLSSIGLDCERIGYRAAVALDAALGGAGLPSGSRIAIAPGEVAERESTRIFVCDDRLASLAATYIRCHALEGIGVPEVLAVVPASRRALETRFRAALGRSLHEEIVRVRLTRAKRLLRDTDLTMDRIAGECGFGALQRFHAAFKEAEGVAPGRWREREAGSRRRALP